MCTQLPVSSSRTLRVAITAALFVIPVSATNVPAAQIIEVTKNLGWDFVSRPGALAQQQGSCNWNLYAFADCSHANADTDQDVGTHNWPANAAHGPHVQLAFATVGHAWSSADRTYRAAAPAIVGQVVPGVNRYHTDMTVDRNCDGALVVDGTWHSRGTGKMRLRAGNETSATLTGVNNGVILNWANRGHSSTVVRGNVWSRVRDPITVEVSEIETGITYSQVLFECDIEAGGLSDSYSWEWTSNSISLHTPRDLNGDVVGSISVSGDSSSPWLTNAMGSFGASLGGGNFAASGAWAALPWQITYDGGDAIAASLPAEGWSGLDLSYTIPDSILRDGYTYSHVLEESTEHEAMASVVPEPMVVGFGVALLSAGRRRRN